MESEYHTKINESMKFYHEIRCKVMKIEVIEMLESFVWPESNADTVRRHFTKEELF